MAVKLKKGINPVGTNHLLVMYGPSGAKQHKYRVRSVSGAEKHVPGIEPILSLSYAGGKTDVYPQNYITLPLSVFVADAIPVEKSDIFWDVKIDE